MKQLTCEMCGSTDMIKEDGVFVCQSCGCKYSVEEAKKMMIEGTVEIKGAVQVDKNNEIDALLKRIFMFLEEGDWSNADKYCEKVLDIDPENAEAYLGKLMVEYELNYIEQFTDLDSSQYPINSPKKILPDVEESNFFSKMRIYANSKIKNILQERNNNLYEILYSEDGCTLTHIGASLTEVKIAEGVQIVDSELTLGGNNKVEKIVFPNSVTRIKKAAFENFHRLRSVQIPPQVKVIEESTFDNCRSLIKLTLPYGVTKIEGMAFDGCPISELIIPNSVITIADFAFGYEYSDIQCITIPDSVQEIGNYIFGSEESNLNTLKTSERIFKLLVEKSILDPCINLESIELDGKFFNAKEVLHTTQNVELEDKKDDYKHEEATLEKTSPKSSSSNGCYIATSVYGSYDCPQVWTLRRYRDDTLGATWYGRAFIRTYYAISPTLVKWFGNTNWFKKMWKSKLDRMVIKLQSEGVESAPYKDKER